MTTATISESEALTLALPRCVKCGEPWQAIDGLVVDHVWCSSKTHGTLWYDVHNRASRSLDWEIPSLGEYGYEVRWACNCMRQACSGRNVIFENTDYDEPRPGGLWYFDAPYAMTIDDVKTIVSRPPDELE